jgi:hypothetical protein
LARISIPEEGFTQSNKETKQRRCYAARFRAEGATEYRMALRAADRSPDRRFFVSLLLRVKLFAAPLPHNVARKRA